MSSASARRGPWSAGEDETLLALVRQYGAHNWVRIAAHVGSRTPKQCRERYHQNLKPTLNHEPITPAEGELIEQLVAQFGTKWAEIARRLPGRSDNAVKNWWNGGVNRRRRNTMRQSGTRRASTQQRTMALPPLATPRNPLPEVYPTYEQSLTLPPIDPALSRMENVSPLPSPSMLKTFSTSRRSSRDGTPSMVSDRSSVSSGSPRMPGSPVSQNYEARLPPLVIDSFGAPVERRQSVHIPQYAIYEQAPSHFAYASHYEACYQQPVYGHPQMYEHHEHSYPSGHPSPASEKRMALGSVLN